MTALITPLSDPPSRADPESFVERSDTFMSELPVFALEANALAEEVNAKTLATQNAVIAAENQVALAAEQKTLALNSANAAALSASNALASENAAADSAAESEASAIAASKLNLGPKASAPTVDNQGAALLTGATYYDTVLGKWRVWNGSAWTEGLSAVAGVSSINSKTGVVTLVPADIGLETASQVEMEAGTETALRAMSPLRVAQAIAILGRGKIIRSARTSNTALTADDIGKLIDITSGTFAQTFNACSTLGSGWSIYLRNSGTGDITLDPNASETIDGLTSYVMYPGEVRLIQCDGTALRTIVLSAFYKVFDTSGTFIKPPGYALVEGMAWGGGASGSKNTASSGAAGGGGAAGCPFRLVTASFASSVPITIGSGGNPVTGTGTTGLAGGSTTFGSLFTAPGAPTPQSVGSGSGGDGGSVVEGVAGWTGPIGSNGAGSASIYAGGSGAGINSGTAANGGSSVYGAGGGGNSGSATPGNGGPSVFGGAGGAGGNAVNGSPGAAPGGGGGGTRTGTQSGAGARGELRIWGVI